MYSNISFNDSLLKKLKGEKLHNLVTRLNEWGLNNQQFYERLDNWFNNFYGEEDKELAYKILMNIEYLNYGIFNKRIKMIYDSIQRKIIDSSLNTDNIVIVTPRGTADSADRHAYDIVKAWGISKSQVCSIDEVDDIIQPSSVLVSFNDTHGSGNQFVKEMWFKLKKYLPHHMIIVACITISKKALDFFKKEMNGVHFIPEIPIDDVKSAFTIEEYAKITEYGKKVYPKHPIGYGNTGLLVAYYFQCPNNTLPIIWADGSNNVVDGKAYTWSPLFPYKPKKKTTFITKTKSKQSLNEKGKKDKEVVFDDNLYNKKCESDSMSKQGNNSINSEFLNKLYLDYCNWENKIKYKLIDPKLLEEYKEKIGILITTVSDIETYMLHSKLKPIEGDSILKITKGKFTYYLGKLGVYNIAHCVSNMGSFTLGGSSDVVNSAILHWQPKMIISVGIAFGMFKNRQNLGDVLFANMVIPYDSNTKLVDGKLLFREPWFPITSRIIINRIKNMISLKNQHYKFHLGSILSGGYLIDDSEFKKILRDAVKSIDVIGGEMEAYGIYKAAIENNLEHCVTIKAVCDWAENKNKFSDNPKKNSIIKDKHQLQAANNAVSACCILLSEGYAFEYIGVLSVNEMKESKKTKSPDYTLEDYKKKIIKETKYVNLKGIPIPKDKTGVSNTPRVLLDKIYIKLQAITRNDKKKEIENEETQIIDKYQNNYLDLIKGVGEYLYSKHTENINYAKCINLTDILSIHAKFVVLGGPGSGKSTLLRYIANQTARDETEEHLPILIRLKEYAYFLSDESNNKYSLEDFVIARETRTEIIDFLKKAIVKRKILWLLDALDEAESYSEEIKEEILKLPKDHKIILTSRPVGYDEGKLHQMEHFEVLPLSQDSGYQFFHDWYKQTSSFNAEERLKWIKNQLSNRPQIRHLTKNPLLLTFLAILSGKSNAGDLPNTRSELYELYIHELLVGWEDNRENSYFQKILNIVDDEEITKDLVIDGLYDLGAYLHHMYYSPSNKERPLLKEAMNVLAKNLQEEFKPRQAKAIAKYIINLWIKAGVLERWHVGRMDFLCFRHISFQEFCVAQNLYFLWKNDKKHAINLMKSHFFLNKWQEPILMLSEMFDGIMKEELISIFSNYNDKYVEYSHPGIHLSGLIIAENSEYHWKESAVKRILKILLKQLPVDSAMNVLKEMGRVNQYVLDELMKCSKNDIFAIRLMGEIGNPEAIHFLIEAIKNGDSYIQDVAVESLGKIGSNRAITLLIEILKEKGNDFLLRNKAAEALGEIGGDKAVLMLIKALEGNDRGVQSRAIKTLGKIGDNKAVSLLIEVFKDKNQHVFLRSKAAEALGEVGDNKVVSLLIEVMKDKNQHFFLRSKAAEALGEIGDDLAVPLLIKALEDETTNVRKTAVKALSKIRNNKVVSLLIEILKDKNQDVLVRRIVAKALGEIGDNKAVPLLIKTLEDVDVNVRREAVKALGEIGDNKAVSPLIKTLEDADGSVRGEAVEALGKIGDNKAVPLLIEVLKDENHGFFLRSQTVGALGKIGDNQVVSLLIEVLKDKNQHFFFRSVVAEALGELGDNKAVPLLIEVLKDKNHDFFLRGKAAKAIGKIGDDKAVSLLIEILKDIDQSMVSMETLVRDIMVVLSGKEDDKAVLAIFEVFKKKYPLKVILKKAVNHIIDKYRQNISV